MNSVSEDRPDHGSEQAPAISPFGILNILLRHRRVLVLTTVIGLMGGAAATLLQEPWFEAEVRFVSSLGTSRAVGGVGSDLGPIQARDPFDYYTNVLTSSEVLDAVLATKAADGRTMRSRLNLPDNADAQTARDAVLGARTLLDRSTRAPNMFPVLIVRSGWTDPVVAADLANAFVTALANYDRLFRTAAARGRREFIEAQVKETAERLTAAENELRSFLEQNRLLQAPAGTTTVTPPPQLTLRRDQLQREITVQADLYLTLKRAVDQARIAQLDEASSVVVIERAAPSPQVGTGRRITVMWGGIFGLMAGLWWVLVVEIRRRMDLASPDAREFVGHVADIRQSVSTLGRRAARALAAESEPEQKT